jgi:opacity protein-like surface antigen
MRGRRHCYLLGALLLIGACTQAPAQSYEAGYYGPEEQVHWHMDIGYDVTTGQIADFLRDGGTIGGGISWQPDDSSPLALRADLNYSRFDATRQLIGTDGYGDIVDLAVDGEYRMPLSPYLTGFAVAGIGVAHRRIALTDDYCEPFFGYCDYGLVTGAAVVASANTTGFAWNAGLGLDFAVGNGETFFVEARFTRIEITQPTDFVPIRVGVRF